MRRWLTLIVILGGILRFVSLADIPYGFDGDEAAFGYYGYSLITNASDEYGNKLPLYFPSIGDYKYPVYAYLTALPVAIFGLSEFSTRFISAFSGTLLIVITYSITKILFKSNKVSLVSAFLIAISPYGIMFSRGAFESNLATLFIAMGIWMILKFTEKKKRKFLFLSAIFFILSAFTYSATRVFIPLFIILSALPLVKDKKIKLREKSYYFIYALTVISIISVAFMNPESRVRASDISIFANYKVSENIRDSIWEDGISQSGNVFITRVFHNKIFAHALFAFKGYLDHFSPTYLFATSNPLMFKYSVPGMGLFYFFEFVTFIFGIVALAKNSKGKSTYLLALWMIISPIPSALTVETPNPIRALMGFPPLEILSAFGLIYFVELSKGKLTKKLIIIFSGFVILFNFLYFFHQYTIHDTYHRPWETDGGMGEMVSAVDKHVKNYEKVVIKNDPYIFFLFFNKVTPIKFLQESKLTNIELGKWEYVNEFGKIIFKMPYDCPKIGRLHTLYVCKGTEIPQNSNVLEIIRFSDGVPAYTLIEFVPYSQKKQVVLPEGMNYMVETDLSYKEGLLPEEGDRYW